MEIFRAVVLLIFIREIPIYFGYIHSGSKKTHLSKRWDSIHVSFFESYKEQKKHKRIYSKLHMPIWCTLWDKWDVCKLWSILKKEPRLSGLLVSV